MERIKQNSKETVWQGDREMSENEIIVDTVFNTLEKPVLYYRTYGNITMNKYYYFSGYGSEKTDTLNKLLLERIKSEAQNDL